jgi:hypothetical protein
LPDSVQKELDLILAAADRDAEKLVVSQPDYDELNL